MSDYIKRTIHYISSKEFLHYCDHHPKTKFRASMIDQLLDAYHLKKEMKLITPIIASKHDLLNFHSNEFVECLEKIESYFQENIKDISDALNISLDISSVIEEIDVDIISHGFGYDCEIFTNMYSYVKYVAGATLTATNLLISGDSDLVINVNGGWHHAHNDEAAGFCYVNDVVIGILNLMKKFKRILYIDLDIHHGDGVEEAFKYSKKVMTLSVHKYVHGFFPGSGSVNDVGIGSGTYYTVNIPLKDGIRDKPYYDTFSKIFEQIHNIFSPEVIVCQCGTDMLSGDPLGGFNLTSKAMIDCVKDVYNTKIPLLLLGGGGYHLPNTSRCWAQLIASLLDKELDDNIPEHDYLEKYGPDFCIAVSSSNRKDENSDTYIASVVNIIIENIKNIQEDKENEVTKTDHAKDEKEDFDDEEIQEPPIKRKILDDSNI